MKQHFPQKFASLKRLFAVLAILVAGTNCVLAQYTESNLVADGWTKVTTLEALQTAANNGNLFVLLDTRDSQMAMTCTSEPRPVYQTLSNPKNNVWQAWLLSIKDNYYQFRNLSRNKEYLSTVTGETWNCFYNTDNSTINSEFSFALSNGKWMITNLYSNQYLGHWGDNENAATAGEGIATNKPTDKNYAAGFYIYTIGASEYYADYGQAQQEITSYFIKNPSFETGDMTGWTLTRPNGDGNEVGVYTYDMTHKDGTYLFNGWSWWSTSISISQSVANLPAGEYEVSAVLAAWENSGVKFISNSVRTTQIGTGDTNGILTTNAVSIGDDGLLSIEVRKDINWWDYPEGETAPRSEIENFFKADDFRLKCNGLYLSALASQLPNNNSTELIPGMWYVYDVASDGNYSLQGDLGSMVYTTNGQQLFTSATGQTVDEAVQLSAGKVFFKTSKTGVTLQLTKMSSVNDGEVTFKACALNVDGMPNKILGITLNGDGPGESGSVLIGQYLKASGIDIIGVSEDFNYNNTIYNEMSSDYNQGHYRGGLSLAGGNAAGLSGTRFDTDGLNIFVKNTYTFGPTAESYDSNWQLWSHQEGSLTDGDGGQFDELVKKGFRYYEVTLKSGFTIDVFVLHMDAGSRNGDSGTAVDGKDALARNDQLLQLKNYILNNKDNGRPKIVIGDTNCRYTRDKVKENFIDQINNDGRYVAKDAWVELVRDNDYPVYNTASLTSGSPNSANREIVDKIFYLNPTSGTQRIKAMAFNIDESYTLGDHEPVVVTFKTTGASNTSADQSTWWKGEDPTAVAAGATKFYIYNVGRKVFATDSSTPTVTDIHHAVRWGKYGSDGNEFTISRGTGYRFKDGEISTGSGARTFSVIASSNTSGAYNLQWKSGTTHHWFGINDDGNYNTGNTSNSVNKDWFFISQEQKDAYDEYVAAYNNAQLLTSLPNFSQQTALKALLAAADGEHANYDNCKGTNGYTAQLKSIYNQALAEYKAYIANDETANIVNPSFEDADISAWTYNTSAGDVGRKDLGNNTYKFTATDGANIGSWTFNTWDGGSTQHHYVRQSTAASLPAGYYIMKAYVATDKEYITTSGDEEVLHNRHLMYLMVNDKEYSIVVNNAKEQGVPYEVLVYHNGGTMTVGAHSDNSFNYWFKVDAFSLTRYASYYDVNVTAAQWATVSLPVNTTIPSGVQVYYATQFKDGDSETLYKLHLEEYSGTTLPSGTSTNANNKPSGFLVYAETPQVYRFYVTNNTATVPSGNLLNGTPTERIESSARDTNKDQYVLANKTTGVGLYKLADGQGIKRFYAYVEYDKNAGSTKDGFLLSTNDDTNGIESMNGDGYGQNATGIATIHSLNGARLNTLRRGVNIIRMNDGSVRKVIIR